MLTINKDHGADFKYEMRMRVGPAPVQPVLVPRTCRFGARPRYGKEEWYQMHRSYLKEILGDIFKTIHSVHESPVIEVNANRKRIKRAVIDALYNSSSSTLKCYNFLK